MSIRATAMGDSFVVSAAFCSSFATMAKAFSSGAVSGSMLIASILLLAICCIRAVFCACSMLTVVAFFSLE